MSAQHSAETLRQFTARLKRAGWAKTGSTADGILFTWPGNGFKFYPLDWDAQNGCERWRLYADGVKTPPQG